MTDRPTESTSVAVVAVGTPSRAHVREYIFFAESPIVEKILARDTPKKQLLQLLHCYMQHGSKPIPHSATATQLLQLLPTNIHANLVNGEVN